MIEPHEAKETKSGYKVRYWQKFESFFDTLEEAQRRAEWLKKEKDNGDVAILQVKEYEVELVGEVDQSPAPAVQPCSGM